MKQVFTLSLMTTCVGFLAQGNAAAAPYALPLESKTQGKIFDSASSTTVPPFFYETIRRKEGEKLISTTIYKDRAGKVLVEENTTYENGKLLRYTYDQKQVNEYGEIELKNGKVFYKFRPAGKGEETDSESIEENMIVPDMVPAVVQTYWKELMGETR